jgi:hypothetical protein
MNKLLLAWVGFGALVAGAWASDPIGEYLKAGDLMLEAGGLAILHEYEDSSEKDAGLGLGFVQVRYRTPVRGGLQVGGWWLAVRDLWERRDGNFDEVCATDNELRELFGSWEIPGANSQVKAGRFKISMTGLDGDSHEGVEATSEAIPGVSLRAAAIRRWVNNASIHMNFLGMSSWQDVEEANEEAGEWFWMGSAKFDLPGDGFVEPFFGYQDNVMLLTGADWDIAFAVGEGRRIGFDGTVARYGNDAPEASYPDYEDVHSWRLHAYYGTTAAQAGAGWFGVSDDLLDLGKDVFDWFDPMTVDSTMPYDDRNNAQLWYVDGTWTVGGAQLTARYGFGKNRAIGIESHEIDLLAEYALTPSLNFSAFVAYNAYSGNELSDYSRVGMVARLSY